MYYLVLLINLSRSILLVIFSKNIFHVFFYGQFWHLPWWNYLNKALLLIHLFRIAQLFLFLAILLGFIPDSGPHLLFFTLYWNGQIEFTALLVSSIVQDGHGLVPLLASSRRDFSSKIHKYQYSSTSNHSVNEF